MSSLRTDWAGLPVTDVIGTDCTVTSKEALLPLLESRAASGPWSVDFTNVQIVTMRRTEPAFRETTSSVDSFIPDSEVLRWAVNWRGGEMPARVYGPDFMAHAIRHTASGTRHFFLGGSAECLAALLANIRSLNPALTVAGSQDGYFKKEQNAEIVRDILAADPDFIWVGLGTPKQQAWIHENKARFPRGVLLAVGFAFDVNAGTKKDAPRLLQRLGLTWLFRLVSEPRRLLGRYVKYNSLFLWHLGRQGRGQ
jgi:N-acetylglucosaminyldiphosphoundecaprenol N-acetyl-beta-D-mannosaminyltransferase